MGALRSAMVSLWTQADSRRKEDFLGSGVFIDRATILTVRHIAQVHRPLFALCNGKVAAHQVCRVECHPDIDVAVVWLRDHPLDVKIAPVDASLFSSGQSVQIAGYFEREYEAPSTAIVKQQVADDRHYLIDLKQPHGYSGSPVEVDGKVRGVVCRHYKDPNTGRGCFIAVDQFTDWLAKHVPAALVLAKPAALSAAPPVVDRREVLYGLARDKLRRSLSAKLFDKFPAELIEREGAVPLQIAEALREDVDDVGEAAVQGVLQVARDLGELLQDDSVSLTPKEKDGLKDRLKEAMGWACRLCIGERAAVYASLKDFTDQAVALDTPPGATVLFGQVRHQSWAVMDRDGIRTVKDEHAILPCIELGEGLDVKRGITKAVAASFSVTGQFSGEVDPKLENLLRGKAKGAAADGKARYVVLEAGKGTAIDSEIRQWIRATLGIGSIELTGFDDAQGLLTIEEGLMLDRVTRLLDLFTEPEWN